MLTSNEIRRAYLQFFADKNHAIVPSSSLVPENDPTTLFTGSGMQPMLQYLLGAKHPLGTRIADSQKSFRAQDIDEVGDNRHTTFFEMLGNWSFGDYFKREQITWMFEFLTQVVKLDPRNLYVTCYAGNSDLGIERDTEAAQLWQGLFQAQGVEAQSVEHAEERGMQGGRIFYYGDKKNWWSRAGVPGNMPVGEPGGPDTEMFWDFGAELQLHEQSVFAQQPCHVNCDCGRFMEIGNNVFMAYMKTENGFEKLPAPNVDFGGGLERIAAALRNDRDMFNIDLFDLLRTQLEHLSGKAYGEDESKTRAFRIVLDHIRAATFLIADAVNPSNTDRGYVVRRLLRRAVRYADVLGVPQGKFAELSRAVVQTYTTDYPKLSEMQSVIADEIAKEEAKFRETLHNGIREFEKISGTAISGQQAFDLYQSYGFPLEMTQDLAMEKGMTVDVAAFNTAMEAHQKVSKGDQEKKFKGGLAGHSDMEVRYHTATHLLHQALRTVLGDHAYQKGSNITPERLRFDFSHPQKMTPEEKQRVEELVNAQIQAALPVRKDEIALEEARARGAIGLFGETYPDVVSVYQVGEGEQKFSLEFCGGPHVSNTNQIGTFKILKEEAVSAGVRRIKAVVEILPNTQPVASI